MIRKVFQVQDTTMIDLTVAILAGGKSTRMGTDKTMLQLFGQPLVGHVAARLDGLGRETIVITNQPQQYQWLGLSVYSDVRQGEGPLAGIHTALTYAACDHVLVVAADMPFLNRDLLSYLASLAAGVDVVVPRLQAGLETLHAVYSRVCLDAVQRRLEAGKRRVISFYEDVRVRCVDAAEIARFDPEYHSFFNINTPDDLEVARRIAAAEGL
jgi:molybdopterin-guanine dinucleotide biosynthesis protein A